MQDKGLASRDTAKKSFVFYYDWRSRFEALTDTESKAFLIAMLDYAEYGKAPDFEGNRILDAMFSTVRTLIDDDFDRWLSRTNAKRENGKKGGRPSKEARNSPGLKTEQNLVGSVRGYSALVEPDNENDNENVNKNILIINNNVNENKGLREDDPEDTFYKDHPLDLRS